jgi:hypothetical protein
MLGGVVLRKTRCLTKDITARPLEFLHAIHLPTITDKTKPPRQQVV